MKKAASYLIGTHDFKSFTDLKKSKKSTVRHIEKIDICETEHGISVEITGNSFLYHMVRIIIGSFAFLHILLFMIYIWEAFSLYGKVSYYRRQTS